VVVVVVVGKAEECISLFFLLRRRREGGEESNPHLLDVDLKVTDARVYPEEPIAGGSEHLQLCLNKGHEVLEDNKILGVDDV